MPKTVAEMTDAEIMEAGLAQGINPDYDLPNAASFRNFCKAMDCENLPFLEAESFVKENFPKVGFIELGIKMQQIKNLQNFESNVKQ